MINLILLQYMYLVLTKFEDSTVSYEPSFPFDLWLNCEAWGHKSPGKMRILNLRYGPRKPG